MKRSGHFADLPADALPGILWQLLHEWLAAPPTRKPGDRRARGRKKRRT